MISSDWELIHLVKTLDAEIMEAMSVTSAMSHAVMGRLEMMTACSDELVSRGYRNGVKADGSDLPVDCLAETTYGKTARLPNAVRVF